MKVVRDGSVRRPAACPSSIPPPPPVHQRRVESLRGRQEGRKYRGSVVAAGSRGSIVRKETAGW